MVVIISFAAKCVQALVVAASSCIYVPSFPRGIVDRVVDASPPKYVPWMWIDPVHWLLSHVSFLSANQIIELSNSHVPQRPLTRSIYTHSKVIRQGALFSWAAFKTPRPLLLRQLTPHIIWTTTNDNDHHAISSICCFETRTQVLPSFHSIHIFPSARYCIYRVVVDLSSPNIYKI